jgi:hypothetical protein
VNWNDPTGLALIAVGAMFAARLVWTFRRHESHRLARFLGLPVDGHRLGRFYWIEGVFSREVQRAMSPEYARKYRWLLTRRAQRTAVVLVVASWLLSIYGTLDLTGSLGFADSGFSWWSVMAFLSYLLIRGAVRVVADAPDDLLDERLVALRNRSYLVAYRWLGLVFLLVFGFMAGALETQASAQDGAANFGEAMWFGVYLIMFVAASLPSMVLAWGGVLTDGD